MPDDVQEQRDNNVGGVTGKGFKPGQSGNPGGRPKGTSLTALLREAVDREDGAGRTVGDVLIDVLIGIARAGDRQAIKDVFERVDGKLTDKLEIDDKRKEYDVTTSPDDL